MRADAIGPAVLRIEALHGLLVLGLWGALLPTGVLEPRALFAGALFMGANFLLLSSGIRWVLTPFAGKGRIRTGVALLTVKMALFLGLLSLLLLRVQLDALSFTLGFSSLLVAIVLDRIWLFSSIGG